MSYIRNPFKKWLIQSIYFLYKSYQKLEVMVYNMMFAFEMMKRIVMIVLAEEIGEDVWADLNHAIEQGME